MKLKVFAVYDVKAEAYLPPFFTPTRGQALRMFVDAAGDKEHQFCKHPADYTLFEIAEYDDSTALITPLKTPVSLGVALEFVSQS